jgi:DNA-binding SARP family transcriptional activator/DNA-binding beta-propeller fold protein YncE
VANAVEISLLGPVEATLDGQVVDLGPPQQRALLAVLAARPGTLTPIDAIVDALWPESPPATAAKIVQTYVSRLRKALGADAIERRGGGYALRVPPEAIDALRFEQLVAKDRPGEGLALWRGPALADLASLPGLRGEAERLDELRLRAQEDQLDAELATGRYAAVAESARALLTAHPHRERLVGQLMTALYGVGRQAEALDVYRQARTELVDELGLEPGPALRALERRILAQDPALLPTADIEAALAAAEDEPRSGRRRLALVGIAVGLVAATLVAIVALARSPESEARPRAVVVRQHSLVRIDPKTNRIVESIPVGREPVYILATPGAVWLTNDRDRTVSRIDLRTRKVRTIGGLPGVGFLARDQRGSIYASGWDYPFVWYIDPRKVEVVGRFKVRSRAVGLAVGGGSLWIVDRLINSVMRYDLARDKVADVIPVGADPLVAAFGYGALWVANSDDGTLSVIRTGVGGVETIEGDFSRPYGVASGEGGVWVGDHTWSTVTRIDPDTRKVVTAVDVSKRVGLPSGVYGLAVGAGAVWVPNRYELNVVRIDPRTNKVAARIKVPFSPNAVAVAGDAVWVAVTDLSPD